MKLILRYRKKKLNEWLTLFVLFMPFCFGLFIQLLNFPSFIKYFVDIAWIILVFILFFGRFKAPSKEIFSFLRLTIFFVIVTMIGFLLNLQSPLYYLWGFRNNFRFFVFFFSCILFFKERYIENYLNMLDKLYYINFLITLVQFFVLNKTGDYLGGIFGVEKGCNAYTVIFMSIIVAKSILYYLSHKERVELCVMKCGMALIISALAELKFFYAVFVMIIILAVLFTDFSRKKITIIITSIGILYLGVFILGKLFPTSVAILSLEGYLNLALSDKGYTSSGDMNRLTSVPIVWKMFMDTWKKRLFGLGLGNCDTSVFSFVNTAFSKRYRYLNYSWFSIAFMFMETGILGLSCYILFFVLVFILANKKEKKHESNKNYCQLSKIMSILCLLIIIYNSSMRTEAGYMAYFILALPFIKSESRISKMSN